MARDMLIQTLVNRSSAPLALLALLVALPARAQSDAPAPAASAAPAPPEAEAAPSVPDSTKELARGHFTRGVELAGQGDYEPALAEFLAAYQASPHFAVLYNIAQAYILLGRPIEAIATLEQYLREGGDQIPAERSERVAQQIDAQRIQVAQLRIAVNVPSAAIELDGRAVGSAPLAAPLQVNPGTHLLSLRAPDRPPLLRSVTLGAGQMLDLALELPAPPPAVALAVPPEPPPSAVPPVVFQPESARDTAAPAPAPDGTLRTLSYVLGGAGVVLAGSALAHYVWNHGRYDDWQAENQALTAERVDGSYVERQQANNALSESIESAESVTLGLALASAACLTSGAVLFAIDMSRSSGDTATAGVGGVRVGLRGEW
jgi:tetratricopeptide (TPR) repeat protein